MPLHSISRLSPSGWPMTEQQSSQRKKSPRNKDAKEDADIEEHSTFKQATINQQNAPHSPSSRSQHPSKLKSSIDRFEQEVLSDSTIERIYSKFTRLRYSGRSDFCDSYSQKCLRIHRAIQENSATPTEQDEWNMQITFEAAKKLCSIIDHLLSSGPLTESELSILDRSVHLLKSYYVSRSQMALSSPTASGRTAEQTYIPKKETFAYKIFIGELVEPSNTFIFTSD